MKTILCYGDSNTWGAISSFAPPKGPSSRFDENTRWGGVLRNALGADYRVIEEGLCGRTSVYGTAQEPYKNGEPYLLPCVMSHKPLDLVALMLGSNDLRTVFNVTKETLGDGISRLIDIINGCPACGAGNRPPKILLISPVLMVEPDGRRDFYEARGCKRAEALSACFGEVFERVAREKGCAFLNASSLGGPDRADGLHMDAAAHQALGEAAAKTIREMLEG